MKRLFFATFGRVAEWIIPMPDHGIGRNEQAITATLQIPLAVVLAAATLGGLVAVSVVLAIVFL